jgi:hypothetical protein
MSCESIAPISSEPAKTQRQNRADFTRFCLSNNRYPDDVIFTRRLAPTPRAVFFTTAIMNWRLENGTGVPLMEVVPWIILGRCSHITLLFLCETVLFILIDGIETWNMPTG